MDTNLPPEGDALATSKLQLKHRVRLTAPDQPLVFLVHGRAGTFDVMWAFRRNIPDAFNAIAPQAPLPDPIGGFSWWLLGSEGVRKKEGADAAATELHQFIAKSIEHYHLRPPCIIAAGFSQGAALTSIILQRADNPLDGAALLAGLVIPQDNPVRGKTRSILMLHGTADHVIPVETAQSGFQTLQKLGYPGEFVTDPVGHKIGTSAGRALTAWFSSFSDRPS